MVSEKQTRLSNDFLFSCECRDGESCAHRKVPSDPKYPIVVSKLIHKNPARSKPAKKTKAKIVRTIPKAQHKIAIRVPKPKANPEDALPNAEVASMAELPEAQATAAGALRYVESGSALGSV